MTDETRDTNEATPPLGEEVADGSTEGVQVRVVDKRWWARGEGDGEGELPSNKPSYVAELERQLADKDGLLTSYAAKYKEAAADFEDARARLRREITKDIDRERRRVLATFLDIVDNLDRAVEAAREEAAQSSAALLTGFEMVRQQFLGTLESHGVSPIDPAGRPFDPTEHDAISIVVVEDPAQQDVVVEVVKLGYRVGEEVLRPASVVVGKHEAQEEARSTDPSASG